MRIDKIRVYLSVFRMKTICYKSFFANVINSIAATIQIWEICQDFCFLFQFSSSLSPLLLFLFFLLLFLPQILDRSTNYRGNQFESARANSTRGCSANKTHSGGERQRFTANKNARFVGHEIKVVIRYGARSIGRSLRKRVAG